MPDRSIDTSIKIAGLTLMQAIGNLPDLSVLLTAGCIALAAGLLHGYSGFGGALMMVPVMSHLLDPAQAVAVTMIAVSLGQISLVVRAAPIAQWRELIPFLAACSVAMPLGVFILAVTDVVTLRRLVAFGTIAMATLLLSGWAYRGRRTILMSGIFGALIGLIGGASGQGGPIAVAYFIAAPTDAHIQRANIVTAVSCATLALLVGLFLANILTAKTFYFGMALSVPFILGTWLGGRAFALVPIRHYKPIVLGLLFLAGISTVLA
ncbi:MAG: sulfite exporter TauE/SafE family protein [Hyphomicrobium sp.]